MAKLTAFFEMQDRITSKITNLANSTDKYVNTIEKVGRCGDVAFTSVADNATKASSKVSAAVDDINGKTERFAGANAKITAIGAAAIATIGVAAASTGTMAVNEFRSFEKGMNEVFTLLPGISQDSMAEMTKQVKQFSKDFGALPEQVVPALYQALSAGVSKDNVFEFLEVTQKAAEGGVTQLKTAVDGISSVVNAYGSDVIGAAQASDLMFTAVRMGKTNFEQLSQSLFNVIPTASALGVQFGDVTAAMASMTAQGVPTSVATTQMRQLLVELSKAGGKPAQMFEQLSGKTFKDFIGSGGNVQQALQLMEKQAASMGMGVNDLFGSVEAGSAALSLTGKGTESFSNNLKEMAGSAGATEKAYQQMQNGVDDALGDLQATFKVTLLDMGAKMGPTISAIANGLNDNMPAIQSTLGAVFEAIGTIIGFLVENIDVIGPAVAAAVLTIIVPAFITWATTAWTTAMATYAAMSPMIPLVLTLGAVVALMALAWRNNFMGIKDVTNTVAKFVINIFGVVTARVIAAWSLVGPFIMTGLQFLYNSFVTYFDLIRGVVSLVFSTIGAIINTAFGFVLGLVVGLFQIMTGDFDGGAATIIQTVSDLIENIKTLFSNLIAGAIQIGSNFAQGIVQGFTGLIGGIADAAQNAWNRVTSIVSGSSANVNMAVSGAPTEVDGSHANGLDYVPYDGYVAELHKGESVLTANETQAAMNTSSSGSSSGGSSNKTSIGNLFGNVTINNQSDIKAVIKQIEAYLTEQLNSSGEGVYDV